MHEPPDGDTVHCPALGPRVRARPTAILSWRLSRPPSRCARLARSRSWPRTATTVANSSSLDWSSPSSRPSSTPCGNAVFLGGRPPGMIQAGGTCFPPGTAPPAPGITVTPWILLSAGGLMVLLGVASDSVLARIIFGRRGDRPGPRAHAETNLSNRPPTRDDAPQQGENNTERNHHERRTLPQQLPQHQLASLARPSSRDGRLHARC
jgi:hypothetical protein